MITLLFSLLAVSLAGYAIDFDHLSPRDVGASFWLEEGTYSADVSARLDLPTSYLEVHLNPSDPNVDCWWSLNLDGASITSGVFRSATASVVTVLSGTINPGTSLEITTSGCSAGRYATPFNLGDNDGGVYVVDVTPSTQEALSWTYTGPYASNGPLKNKQTQDHFTSQLAQSEAAQGLCRFSNQACNSDLYAPTSISNDGYWLSSFKPVLVTWDGSSIINTTDEVAIESTFWFQNFGTVFYSLCNSSLACADGDGPWVDTDATAYYMNFNTVPDTWGGSRALPTKKRYVGPDPRFSSFITSTMNSTRNFGRSYFSFEPSDQLFSGVLVSYSQYSVAFPYVKVWGLAGNYGASPVHSLIDLRGATSASACTQQDGTSSSSLYSATTYGYPIYGCQPVYTGDAVYSVQWAGPTQSSVLGQTLQRAWFTCGANPGSNLVGADATNCTKLEQWSDLSVASVSTGTMDISGYSFPNGAIITPLSLDLGVPCVFASACTYAPALNQLSWFTISSDGTEIGTQKQYFIENFDSNQIRGWGVEGYTLGANPQNLVYTSQVGFSIVGHNFIPATAFPTPLCNASTCQNGGSCTDPDSTTDCTCLHGFTGSDCSALEPLCPTEDAIVCFNGGKCLDNPARSVKVSTINGEDALVYNNFFLCNCTGTQTANGTGDYYGQYCQFAPPCDVVPCFNGANCINNGQDDFTCDCNNTLSPNSSLPFTGPLCDVSQTTTCDSNPCENGGTCTPDATDNLQSPSGFSCSCANGWTGPTCAIPPTNGCQPSTCQPFGVCVPSSNDASSPAFTQCVCLYGYSGPACAQAPGICSEVDCQNGGVCVGFYNAGEAAASCLCPDPWVGQHCQFNTTAFNTATSQSVGLFVVLLAILSTLI